MVPAVTWHVQTTSCTLCPVLDPPQHGKGRDKLEQGLWRATKKQGAGALSCKERVRKAWKRAGFSKIFQAGLNESMGKPSRSHCWTCSEQEVEIKSSGDPCDPNDLVIL